MQQSESLMTLTAYAQAYLERLVKEKHALGIEIALEKAGCAGYMYRIEPVNTQAVETVKQAISEKLTIFIPKSSIARIKGSQLNYVQKQFETKAVFDNPNVRLACGCGDSVEIQIDPSADSVA